MYPCFAPIAYPAIAIASNTAFGSPSNILLSMKAPGSPSSALQHTYFTSPFASFANFHFLPVGKPAPPLPLIPEFNITSITSSLDMCNALYNA